MGAYTCQFGKVHKVCRCPTPHQITCDVPDEHGPSTEHGVWIFQDKAIHRCIKPQYTKGVKAGDQWKCSDCGKVWTVASLWSDQRDNYTGINWKETA